MMRGQVWLYGLFRNVPDPNGDMFPWCGFIGTTGNALLPGKTDRKNRPGKPTGKLTGKLTGKINR